jgi:two-component system cell cycle response regulator DivK
MSDLKGKRIAVIEDNVTNLAVFATALRRQEVTVIQDAWNTSTVDFLLNNLPLDLILLDIMLRRGINGYDVFEQWQAVPELKDIPVVAVSSLDAESEIPKAQELGFAGFIGKPINLIDFPKQIANCIAGDTVWVSGR